MMVRKYKFCWVNGEGELLEASDGTLVALEDFDRLAAALREIADDARYLMYDTRDCTFDALGKNRKIARAALASLGAKLDSGKAPVMRGVLSYFPRALRSVSLVSEFGARKYTWGGWSTVASGMERYSDALGRHLLAEAYESHDPDSGCLHAAQVAWNALARLEIMLREQERAARPLTAVADDFELPQPAEQK